MNFKGTPSQEQHKTIFSGLSKLTAGAVSIATISKKRAGTKMEISPLRYMYDRDLWFFSLYTHLQQQYQ